MDVRNHIEDSIGMAESFLNLKRGSITWGIDTRKVDRKHYVCAFFKFNGGEFINVMSLIDSRHRSDEGLLIDVGDAHDSVIRRIPSVLSVYGIVNMIETLAKRGVRLVYISDPKFIPEYSPIDTFNLPVN